MEELIGLKLSGRRKLSSEKMLKVLTVILVRKLLAK